jgi:S-adenosylmethionine-diacylglycerol 3-amino-3-carboxypropyl transferase
VDALPLALRPEHFATIRANLERLEWHCTSLDGWLRTCPPDTLQRCNLSDVFEYLSPDATRRMFAALARASQPGARLAYWNMQVPRSGAGLTVGTTAGTRQVQTLPALAAQCYAQDRVPFYSRFVVETIATGVTTGEYTEVCR